jgi:hypothetical protein
LNKVIVPENNPHRCSIFGTHFKVHYNTANWNTEISVFRAFYLLRIIKMDLGERGWVGMNLTDLAEDRGPEHSNEP